MNGPDEAAAEIFRMVTREKVKKVYSATRSRASLGDERRPSGTSRKALSCARPAKDGAQSAKKSASATKPSEENYEENHEVHVPSTSV